MEISIGDAHNHLSSLLKKVEKEPISITRHGKTVAVIISAEEFENLRQVKAYVQMLNLSNQLRESVSAAELYHSSREELEGKS